MGILAMFFQRKSGEVPAATAQRSTQHSHTDEVTIELAKASEDNCSAARRLEGLLTGLLDSNQQLRQGVHWFNAPST